MERGKDLGWRQLCLAINGDNRAQSHQVPCSLVVFPYRGVFSLLEGDPASGVGCYPSALHARPHALPSFPSLLGSCAIGVVRFGRALLGPAAPPSHPLCLFIFAAMAEDGGAASDSPQVRAMGRVLGVQTGGGDTGEPPCSMYQGVPPG